MTTTTADIKKQIERVTGHCLQNECVRSEVCECDCLDCRQRRHPPADIFIRATHALSVSENSDFGDEGRLFEELTEALGALIRSDKRTQIHCDDLQSRMSKMVIERQAQSAKQERVDAVIKAAERVGVYRRTLEDFSELDKPLADLQTALDWTHR